MKVLIVVHEITVHADLAAWEPEAVAYWHARAAGEAYVLAALAAKEDEPFDLLVVEQRAWESMTNLAGGDAGHTAALLKDMHDSRVLPRHVIVLVDDILREAPPIEVAGALLERCTLAKAQSWIERHVER